MLTVVEGFEDEPGRGLYGTCDLHNYIDGIGGSQ
jgi:hypothetical protein